MKKKKIFILLSFIIPILILTGFSLWIITTDHVITPSYDSSHSLAQYFNENNEAVYDTNEHSPEIIIEDSSFSEENFLNTIDFYYKKAGKIGPYKKGKPINAGDYSIKIIKVIDENSDVDTNNDAKQEGALYVNLTIDKAQLKVKEGTSVSVNYNQGSNNGYFTTDMSCLDIEYNATFTHIDNNDLIVSGEINYSDEKANLIVSSTQSYNYTFTPSTIIDEWNEEVTNYYPYSNSITIITKATVSYINDNVQYGNKFHVSYGEYLDEPTIPSKTGYTFNGWYNGTSKWDFSNNKVTNDLILESNFSTIPYTITYNLNGGTLNTPNPDSYNVESEFTLNNPTKNGFQFMGWIEGDSTVANKTVKISKGTIGNKVFTATWGNPILIKLNDNIDVVYDAKAHDITTSISINGVESSLPEGTSITYKYLDSLGNEVEDSSNIMDADTYSVTATFIPDTEGVYSLDPSSIMSATLKISPLNIKMKNIEIPYSDALADGYLGWGKFNDILYNKIEFVQVDDTALPSGINPQFILLDIDNETDYGYYEYADNDDTDTTAVIGSTYYINVQLVNFSSTNNLRLASAKDYYDTGKYSYAVKGNSILKYQTALIGDTYLTIEDALTTGGTIVLAGSNSTVITSFTNTNYYKATKVNGRMKYNLKGSSQLWLTYNGANTLTEKKSGTDLVYSVLYITEKIQLDVNGTINICGLMTANYHATTTRSVLFNNGLIELYGTINSYGYLNGGGSINAYSNSKVYDVLRLYNYYGSGGITLSVSNADIFPISCFSIHNVSCKTKYYKGSYLRALYNIDMSVVTLANSVVILGPGGMFELSSGYINKEVEDTTGTSYAERSNLLASYNISNQITSQREVLDLYGTFTDNSVSISQGNNGITTGQEYPMPIGFMNISLKKDDLGNVGVGTIGTNSYKFMPGSKLTVDSGAKLTIKAGASIMIYDEGFDDAFTCSAISTEKLSYKYIHSDWYNSGRDDIASQFIINGTLMSNGNIGGYIQTNNSSGSVVSLASKSATVKRMTSVTYTDLDKVKIGLGGTSVNGTVNDTKSVSMKLYDGTNVSTIPEEITNTGLYTSIKGGNNVVGFVYSSNAYSYTITFDVDGGDTIEPLTIYTLDTSGSYTLTSNDLPDAYKKYYKFIKWTNPSGGDAVGTTITANSERKGALTVKANYVERVYSINYKVVYEDGTEYLGDISNTTSCSIGDTITLNAITDGNKQFIGWYSDETYMDDSYIGNGQISFDNMMSKIVNPDKEEITLFGMISDDVYYNVTIKDDKSNGVINSTLNDLVIAIKEGESLESSNKDININSNNIDKDPDIDYYFNGFKDENGDPFTLEDLMSMSINSDKTFTINWSTKTLLTIKKGSGDNTPTGTLTVDGNIYDWVGQTKSYYFIPGAQASWSNGENCEGTPSITGGVVNISGTSFEIGTSDITITVNASSCITSGTLLTLADGTQKKVEDLLDTDMLLVFNHETGKFESAPIIFVDRDEWKDYNIVNLEFSNGTKTRLIYEHGYFDLTLNKYVYITEANYRDYIGHEFAFYAGDKVNSVTLTNSYITNEYVGCYSPVTAYHLNYFVDGMLSMPGGIEGLFNIFEYNDDMTYDIEKMNEDIEKYGLYTYEDFKDYLPYEVYLAFPGPYLKVSVEKGYITFEEIIGYIEQYLGRHGLDK